MEQFNLTINGQKVTTNCLGKTTNAVINVVDPATEKVFAQCPYASNEQVDEAVSAANVAFNAWSKVDDQQRIDAINNIADKINDNFEELATLLTREQGKPLGGMGSKFEVGGCIAWTRMAATQSLPVKIIEDNDKQLVEQHRKPIGVVGSITPWNFPLLIAIWHVIPAIRVGCTVVIKPSSYTPLTTLRLVELMNEVLPEGVINVVTGDADVGSQMSEHPDIDKMVFTGSTGTGKDIMRKASDSLKKLTLELGGNDAGIVLPDANIPLLVEKMAWGAFFNSGQTCAAMKRLYIHESIFEETATALTEYVSTMTLGNGLNDSSVMGPVQNARQFQIVTELVEDAKNNGAKVLCGGIPNDEKGYFYPLTLLSNVSNDMRIVAEEQFGPVLPLISYSTLDEAIAMANELDVGLGGSIWTSDLTKGAEIAKRLECGTAWVNKHSIIQPNIPFGGVKSSGIGVEFADEGLMEYTTIQIVNIDKH